MVTNVLCVSESVEPTDMGKSRAEIQRAYRQRLKEKNNEEYLRKERERMRRNYVPSSELSENDKNRRNQLNREKLRKFYQRKREARQRATAHEETSGYETGNREIEERGRLRVKVPFPSNRRKGALIRWKRELSEATSRIRVLEQERAKLITKYKSARRSMQRIKQKQKGTHEKPKEHTPRKATEIQMQEANLSATQKDKIKKPLFLGTVLMKEIKSAKEKTPKGKMKALHRVVSGRIVKKYKCASLLSRNTGLCRHRLGQSDNKNHQVQKSLRNSIVRKHQRRVEEFLKREDNSKFQPGKADVKKVNKTEKKQTYILTDYLSNLYNKFKSENPSLNISFTSFCRARPKYILLTAFSSRSSCLCTKHQNAVLSLKVLKREGIDIPVNPEKAVDNIPSAESLGEKLPETVVWNQWTRVEIEEKGKKKSVTKIVESKVDRGVFITRFEKQMEEFDAHAKRVTKQYEEIKTLKQKLPEHEMLVQLDFAENYSCRSMEEVQSAYFNQSSVTLHPVVAYYRGTSGELIHKSIVIVSDEMGHKASTVVAFIDHIIPILKEIDPDLRRIHYWSDSPTSQYRNKHIFDLIANHEERYGICARWNYFEAGHGKGPCDGLGGSCKRLADEATHNTGCG